MRRGPTGVERAGGGAARTRRGRWRRQAGRKRGHRRRCCAALRTAAMAVMASVRPCRSTEGVRSGGGVGGEVGSGWYGATVCMSEGSWGE